MRFDDVSSEDTRIKFLTDGMLLREAISDSLLRKYSCIILDEAHERTVHTDVLFGVVKAAQRRRKELRKLPLKVAVAWVPSPAWCGVHSASGQAMPGPHRLLLGLGRDLETQAPSGSPTIFLWPVHRLS